MAVAYDAIRNFVSDIFVVACATVARNGKTNERDKLVSLCKVTNIVHLTLEVLRLTRIVSKDSVCTAQ